MSHSHMLSLGATLAAACLLAAGPAAAQTTAGEPPVAPTAAVQHEETPQPAVVADPAQAAPAAGAGEAPAAEAPPAGTAAPLPAPLATSIPPVVAPAAAANAPRAAVPAGARTVDALRADFARSLYGACADLVHHERPQALLRAVVVLRLRLDEANRWKAEVFRDNPNQPAMTKAALDSVARLPAAESLHPEALALLRGEGLVEAWLFQNNGRFALKTLAKEQLGVPGASTRALALATPRATRAAPERATRTRAKTQ